LKTFQISKVLSHKNSRHPDVHKKEQLVLEGGNLQAIEKSDFFKKSDFFAFKMVWEFPSSCTSAGVQKSSGHREIRFFEKIGFFCL
jgi:hypothetical protein